jgi:hypothetical protein
MVGLLYFVEKSVGMEDEQQHGICDKFFFTRERVLDEFIFLEGFCGWVECQVGSNNYLIESCKAPHHRQHILDGDFFKESRAVFFDDFDEMKQQLKQFKGIQWHLRTTNCWLTSKVKSSGLPSN